MASLATLVHQDTEQLGKNVKIAYLTMLKEGCHCEECVKTFSIPPDWSPETDTNKNDTWKIFELLCRYGYPSVSYDLVTYTFVLIAEGVKFVGDGVTFAQAICNCLMAIYGELYND